MDLEAMQLLNLSPIPELSEIELSTMLDQLSGLSDINGDLTDRNVEDIIKEAEDLLDKSIGSKTNETRSTEKSLDELSDTINKDVSLIIEPSEPQLNITKHSSVTVCDYDASHNTSHEDVTNKHFNSPVESPQSKVYSPGGSINHIKSTIDSLKEFSTLVEKKLNSQPQNTSPRGVKKAENENHDGKETMVLENQSIVSSNQVMINPKVKMQNKTTKETKSLNKSIKLLNCFERLYQVKPARCTTTKKPKIIDKAINKKKSLRDSKNFKRSSQQEKVEKTSPSSREEDISKQDTARLRHFHKKNSPEFDPEDKTVGEHLMNAYLSGQIQSIDEKLIIKVLEKMEEIKDHSRKVDVVIDVQKPKGADGLNVEVEPIQPGQIHRLEQQFSVLKEKYGCQMEKLEAENQRLREALLQQQCAVVVSQEIPRVDVQQQTENPEEKRMSFENCKTPKNSPSLSRESLPKEVKESFSQTEEVKYIQEVETKKTDDKENIGGKKKLGRCKPFTDVNTRQKKAFEYETQLLATVRGLQAEITAKDKENKKLKNEIESVRKQIKKLTGTKVENLKKCNIGTQTIGLGPITQKPYNPEEYEPRGDFEKENEDLRTRIKALEEDFELLKEKRISDLQALHQVHEEEMGKVVSKLETQSALTRHLHSLLMNR